VRRLSWQRWKLVAATALTLELATSACSARTGETAQTMPDPALCAVEENGQHAARDLAYDPEGAHNGLATLDVYPLAPPAQCPPTPILMWVHGGGWDSGDKTNQLADKQRLAAEHGWMLVSVNYRLVPHVRYPVPNDDVARAVAWIVAHAAQFGADPGWLAIMGHSAGGGIATAVNTDERHPNAAGRSLSDVDCAVSLDTDGYDVAAKGDESAVYEAMFGADPTQWPDQSPINHVAPDKDIPDFFIVTRGQQQRIDTAKRFAEALRAANVPVRVIEAPGLSHAGVNEAVGSPGERTITPSLVEFLTSCFT
jgi:acetyl esterase/lipase